MYLSFFCGTIYSNAIKGVVLMKKILVIHGPNLNMLGIREPDIYGKETFDSLNERILSAAKQMDIECKIYQSNCEGEIVTEIQKAYGTFDGIVINPGAYTHYSFAIRDALSTVAIPFAEIHISDINTREEFRKFSVLEDIADVRIMGKGTDGYIIALERIAEIV